MHAPSLPMNDIVRCESDSNYCSIFYGTGLRLYRAKTLKSVANGLPQADYLRVHRSHIVRKDKISEFGFDYVLLNNGEKVPVSRRYMRKLRVVSTLILSFLLLITIDVCAQHVGINTITPAYPLTLGDTNGVFAVENKAAFLAKDTSGVYETFLWPRTAENSTMLNFGEGGFQLRNNDSLVSVQVLQDGKVGIGTTMPTAALHVVGQLKMQHGTAAVGRVLTSDETGVATWAPESDPQVGSLLQHAVPKWNSSSLVTGSIYDNGFVGIGTNSPTTNLHVHASGSTGYVGGIGLFAPFMLTNSVTSLSLGKNTTVGNQGEIRFNFQGESSDQNRIEFGFSSIQPFVAITKGQNVGIGTVTPNTKLHVVGQVRIQDGSQGGGKILTSDVNGLASWQSLSPMETDPQVTITSTNGVPRWTGTSLANGIAYDNGNSFGIGTSSPGYRLTLGGSGGIFAVDNNASFAAKDNSGIYQTYLVPRTAANHTILLYGTAGFHVQNNAGTTMLYAHDNGNIGINTNTPEARFQVNGTLKFADNGEGQGKVLTSDASGNATWQDPTSGPEADPQVGSTISGRMPKWNGTTLTDGLMYDSGPNIGIGTDSPTDRLHVMTNASAGYAATLYVNAPNMANNSAAVLLFGKSQGTANRAELRYNYHEDGGDSCRYEFGFAGIQPFVSFTAGQKVGIGTLAPTAKLHVVGNVKITDGTQGAGKVLHSDASGLAYWQAESDPQVASVIPSKIPKWTGSALVDGLIFDNGTKIGIGTTSPTYQLTLSGTDGVIGMENTGVIMAKNNANVYEPVFYPRWSDNRTIINHGSGGMQIRDAANNVRLHITNNGFVGIGTTAPNGLFELVSDQGRKPATSTWTITSDARLKTIEGHYEKGLEAITQLQPVIYHYKNTDTRTFDPAVLAQSNVGLSAQDVQVVFPEAVGTDPDGTLNLNMHAIFIAEINALKELNAKIEKQANIIIDQQRQLNELNAKLDLLVAMLQPAR